MDARRYLELAQALIDDVKTRHIVTVALEPAARRDAISRSYYASFLVGLQFLDSIKLTVAQNSSSHITVQHALNNSGDARLVAIGSKLGKLHSERLIADYEPNRVACEKAGLAEAMLVRAEEIINGLDELSAGKSSSPFDAVKVANSILNWASLTKKNLHRKP